MWLPLGSGVIAEGLTVLVVKGLRGLRSVSTCFLCPRMVDGGGGAFWGLCFEGGISVVAKEKEG